MTSRSLRARRLALALLLLGAGAVRAEQLPALVGQTPSMSAATAFDRLNHNDAELYGSVATLTAAMAARQPASSVLTTLANGATAFGLGLVGATDAAVARAALGALASTGDASAVSVTPNATAPGGTLARIVSDQAAAVAARLPLSGGTLTGPLVLPSFTLSGPGSTGDASAMSVTPSGGAALGTLARLISDQAAGISARLPLAGGTLTGPLTSPSLKLTGTGSTGDVSGMSVTPSATAAAGTLANILGPYVPQGGVTYLPTFEGRLVNLHAVGTSAANLTLAQGGTAFGGFGQAYGGNTQWQWQWGAGLPLSLFAFNGDGTYFGSPLTISTADTNNTGSTTGTVHLGGALAVDMSGTPSGAAAMNYVTANNTGHNGAAGFSNIYNSAADGGQFDVGVNHLSIFTPSSFTANMPKYDHFFWAVTPTDNASALDTTKSFGVGVGEWNVTNNGADFGFNRSPRESQPQHPFGLLYVPENSDPRTGVRTGLNTSFAFSVSRTGGVSTRMTPQAYARGSASGTTLTVSAMLAPTGGAVGEILVGQKVQVGGATVATVTAVSGSTVTLDTSISKPANTTFVFGIFEISKTYIGYLAEPNSIAGRTGRGSYFTGDITGDPKLIPYAPHQVDGAWLHGIDTTLASFSDGNAVHLADGQAVALSTDGATRVFYEAGSGKIVFTRAGVRVAAIDASGNMVIKGTLTQSGSP